MSNHTAKRTLLLVSGFVSLIACSASSQEISFNRDVRPILSDRCFHCHGPDADNQDSEFRLDSQEHATQDLGGYAGVVPGDLEASELHLRIRSSDGDQMPPEESVRQLTEPEKDILDAWIKTGAKFDEHWAFKPIPDEIAVPEIKASNKNGISEKEAIRHVGNDATNDVRQNGWSRTKVDSFVFAELKRKRMQPNEFASREKWLRRVTFDLTGLPPTLEELDAFLADNNSGAEEAVVERLLGSDACAERLTSEWLDVARYSDSFGFQRDDERLVWPYRDWVIGAFKNNMAYDQFVTWQLAGDLMENPTRDQSVATSFNRLHSHKKEGGVALEEFRVENVADRTHTFAAAFMGLTMECARCHDHKYDPTKTKEYYQLSSYFANIDERGLISYFTDATPTPTIPLPSVKQAAKLAEAQASIDTAKAKLAETIAGSDKAFADWLGELKQDASKKADKAADLENAEMIPGLVTSLSFEKLDALPKLEEGEYKNEADKKIASEKIRGLANDVEGTESPWTGAENKLVEGKRGQAILLTGDDAVVMPGIGHYERDQPFSIALWMKPGDELDERAVIYRRSRGWDDAGSIGYELTKLGGKLSAKLVHFWPGNAICVETQDVVKPNQWSHVVVTYDGSSSASGLKIIVDGVAAEVDVVQDHLTRNITQWREGYYDLAIGARYRDRGFKGGQIDEFRVFQRCLSNVEMLQLFDGKSLVDLLAAARGDGKELPKQQESALKEYFVSAIFAPAAAARKQLQQARVAWNAAMDATPAISIMREQTQPRPAFVLTRGAYNEHGEEVTAATPAFLSPYPKDAPRNRLGLAQWLTAPNHPLMARVTVNRYWQMIFARGLVATPEDFGIQGTPPTHPELLDWLARDFINHNWDVRRLLKMLVLSSTYRQSAVVSKAARDLDPDNLWLARGPGQRMSAEMIRDNALAVSGLLNRKIGGPPVKPYDVALAYTPLTVDTGDSLYRRSLYTFWKRTSPAPVMMAMNASKREVCRLRREVTDSPLQALVLLNGSQFVESSRVLAERLLKEHDGDSDAVVVTAFRTLTSRKPDEKEAAVLRALFEEQLAVFEATPEKATAYLGVGEARSPEDSESNSQVKLAAMTVLVNSIMNLDESVRQR